jgi:hypothetical protein
VGALVEQLVAANTTRGKPTDSACCEQLRESVTGLRAVEANPVPCKQPVQTTQQKALHTAIHDACRCVVID